jgi:acyl-CoA thioesterase I
MRGITIADHCIIGVGAVVMGNVPDRSIVDGNPNQETNRLSPSFSAIPSLRGLFVICWCFLSFGHDSLAASKSEQNPMIVAAFGTSLTDRAAWLQPLQDELTRRLNRQVTVLDFGRSGATSEWGVATVAQVIYSDPDVVLVEFASNDAAWFKGVSLHRSRQNITEIVRAIKEARPMTKIFLMTMNSAFGLRGWIRPSLDAYGDLYKSIADELGIGFIDNRPKWRALTKDELRAGIPDGAHPVPELASRILVPNITRAITGAACC